MISSLSARSLLKTLQQSSRTLTIASLALLAALSPISALAQDGVVAQQQPTPQNPPAQNPITRPIAGSPEVTNERVGIRPGDERLLALQDAIAQALQNNLDIEQFRQSVRISEFSLFSLRGFYDYTSQADIGFRNAINPTS